MSRMKIGHMNTPSKILKHFLPTNIVLEEKWAFLINDTFSRDILYCLLQEIETLKTSILRENETCESRKEIRQ